MAFTRGDRWWAFELNWFSALLSNRTKENHVSDPMNARDKEKQKVKDPSYQIQKDVLFSKLQKVSRQTPTGKPHD